MSIQDFTAIVIAITALVTAIVTFLIARANQASLELTRKISASDILFRLDEAFLRHKDVRVKLAPGGDWHRKKNDPTFPKGPNYELPEDLIAINTYMGLFERIQFLINLKVIHIDEVDRWYGSRFINIVMNHKIRDRLIEHKSGWSGFIKLWTDLEQQRERDPNRKKWPEEARLPDKLKSN